MRIHWLRVSGLLALIISLMLAGGCSDSEPLNPTSSDLGISMEIVNVTQGPFTDDPVGNRPAGIDADTANFEWVQSRFRPVLDDSSAALGTEDLGLLVEVLLADINFAEPVGNSTRMTNQVYQLRVIDLGTTILRDNSDGNGGTKVRPEYFDDPQNPTCFNFVREFVVALTTRSIELQEFGQDIYFDIQGGTSSFVVKLDAEKFIDAFVGAFKICKYDSNAPEDDCVANYDITKPETLDCVSTASAFDEVEFKNAAPSYLSFE